MDDRMDPTLNRRALLLGTAPVALALAMPNDMPVPSTDLLQVAEQLEEAESTLQTLDRMLDNAYRSLAERYGAIATTRYASLRLDGVLCLSEQEVARQGRHMELSDEQIEEAKAAYRQQSEAVRAFREEHGLAAFEEERGQLVAIQEQLLDTLASTPAGDLRDVLAKLRQLAKLQPGTDDDPSARLIRTSLDGVERLIRQAG